MTEPQEPFIGEDEKESAAAIMIERVARVIYERRYSGEIGSFTAKMLFGQELTWDAFKAATASGIIVPFVRDFIYADARAYIEAMRAPTLAMNYAGCDPILSYRPGVDDSADVAEACWHAMIDVALAEEAQPSQSEAKRTL